MSIQDLGSLGEFLGSIAVLATLVYLALQTRQNTMAIGAQLDAAALGRNQDNLLSAATSAELGESLRRDLTAQQDLTADDTINQMRLGLYWISMFNSFDWQFRQARRRLLPSYNEAQMAGIAGSYFTTFRSFEGWWEGNKWSFSPEFVEWVESERSKAASR